MLAFLDAHVVLLRIAVAVLTVALVLSALWVGTRRSYRARHGSWRWSTARTHAARHARPKHHPHHAELIGASA